MTDETVMMKPIYFNFKIIYSSLHFSNIIFAVFVSTVFFLVLYINSIFYTLLLLLLTPFYPPL